MFGATSFLNSRGDGFAVLEIVGGLATKVEGWRPFVPLRRTELEGEVAGPLAAFRIAQKFRYRKEDCDRVLEALYRFPLPGDAAVTSVRVRFGDVEIVAELKERKAAEAEYEEAKRQGQQAALLSRESPDVFTLSVTGLRPDEEIAIETSYVQLARAEGAGWSVRIPLTTAPRYTRGDERGSSMSRGQPLAVMRDPAHRFSMDLVFKLAGAIHSPTHEVEVTGPVESRRLRLADREVVPDRDCVIQWEIANDAGRAALHVLTYDDEPSGKRYFLALVAPPRNADAGVRIRREVTLLVDHSGSMSGPKWAASDWAVRRFLQDLGPDDTLGLGVFHDTTFWWHDAPQAATKTAVKDAETFILSHKDEGGTELGVALEQALALKRTSGELARHVLLVTDAQVTDEGRILQLAEDESLREDRRRISLLCIDAAPNSFLVHELADRGGGVARFLTSEPGEGDISTALDEVLEDWAQPVALAMHLEVDREGVEASGRATKSGEGRTTIELGDLPRGRPIWVAGRVPAGSGVPKFLLRTQGAAAPVAMVWDQAPSEGSSAIKALFGAKRVLALEFLLTSAREVPAVAERLARLGFDPTEVLQSQQGSNKVYAENQRAELEFRLRSLLVREALEYGLASSATSFVAVRKEAGRPIEGTVLVGNALASGWSEEFADLAVAAAPSKVSLRRFKQAAGHRLGFAEEPLEAGELQAPRETVVFRGTPKTERGEMVLFDTSRLDEAKNFVGVVSINALIVRLLQDHSISVPPRLVILVYVEDLSQPRARVRVSDVLAQGGERPLNLVFPEGARVRVILTDPDGVWASNPPGIEVALR